MYAHSHATPPLFIGLMSGSSLDGVDAVVVESSADAGAIGAHARLIAGHQYPFAVATKEKLMVIANQGSQAQIATAMELSVALTDDYARAVQALLQKTDLTATRIAAIGCHGQTICHAPHRGYTLQLNQPALLVERTGIAVVADFRARDIAAGGEGAPLACGFHAAFFHHTQKTRWLVNIGGMANVTRLASGKPVIGFDCGPGNVLLDGWSMRHLGTPYDDEGRWAASGRIVPALLAQLQEHPFLKKSPPKSCGREDFPLLWVDGLAAGEKPQDVQATLLELTALSITAAIKEEGGGGEVYLCGGGAFNLALRTRIAALLSPLVVDTTAALGVLPQWVEAWAFAWLAEQALKGKPGNLPSVTNARAARILGAIYPL